MKIYLSILLLLSFATAIGQTDIDVLLKQYNTRSVPYISVQELKMGAENYLILDTRKKEEYEVSHIPNAIWVSEKVNDSIYSFAKADKSKPIVVYCSVGIRSEDFGEKLKKLGYTDVQNLYGSIFAWKDEGYDVVNAQGKVTDSVHVYSKVWGKYLKTGKKVY
ncbi:rhodanese-like domain-containing protein [Dokdonia sinensis]|uniref:rhodanese-like domain-containing protein n=1 Tax=Dokdonia sinensis TaxID=2479847 RepID=UPI001F286C83|nr:rhodanese-like domain-containing protein [Dokdonia sinensis]